MSLLASQASPSLGRDSELTQTQLSYFLRGFENVYRLIMEKRDLLLDPLSPLQRFRDQQIRFVFRATGDYARLLESSLLPGVLRDGILRSLTLDGVSRVALRCTEKPRYWPLIREEHRALELLDVPLFVVRSDSRDIELPTGEIISEYFVDAGTDSLFKRVRALSEADLGYQLHLIRESLADT